MAESKPTLYHMNDAQSQRLVWLLEELEIPYNLSLHSRVNGRAPPELKETHRLGKAPQLKTVDGRIIVESLVIAKYLIDTYDTANRFKGDGAKEHDFIRDDELCNNAAATIGPVMNLELVLYFAAKLSPFFIRPLFSALHKLLRKSYSGPELDLNFRYLNDQLGDEYYFMGSNLSRPDFIISWPMDICMAHDFIDIKKYPKLEKWYARIHERPAWKRSLEKGNGYSFQIHS